MTRWRYIQLPLFLYLLIGLGGTPLTVAQTEPPSPTPEVYVVVTPTSVVPTATPAPSSDARLTELVTSQQQTLAWVQFLGVALLGVTVLALMRRQR